MSLLDNQLNDYLDRYDNEYHCSECGVPINYEGYCSGVCHESSNI
jgi:predicted nucleic acid-binding Zn ribbon protein